MPTKYRKHIDAVYRLRGELNTRLDKLRLDKNERINRFPANVLEFLRSKIDSDLITAYPETEPLYLKLSKYHNAKPENFLITTGADGGIRYCFDTFVNEGDEIVFLSPTFAMVDIYATLWKTNKKIVTYADDLSIQVDDIMNAISPMTSLVIIANPNSPTGNSLPANSIKQIIRRAADLNVPILIDEAYFGFSDITAEPFLKEFDNLIIARTFSKAFGLAGLRIGYLYSNESLISKMYKFRPMYEVTSVSLLFADYLLDNPEIVTDYIKSTRNGLLYLAAVLDRLGLSYITTDTNFIHVDFANKKESAVKIFEKNSLLVRGGLPFQGYENFLRLTIGPQEQMMILENSLKEIVGP
ncbi:aminotransferase class I/II-fold pyridoxal phosphate-dependent enzyme [Leptospira kanakyensis]|uniref:histidinol-phosphate transaminase n=1 Tax=Leptospira kanakyensis TaxID=2484968 RepID=A0A6N4QHV1_9LEPT|nr:aminotransferase class I/II-fold pyridoxal phosphate-dependent enzyme [Leptospira kanakyensis]TGK51919.1 aminotransferase class I/II-fold pyridoxal phosphate-dependent enzyme [Leptospira kanakyensis]TGK57173.1 aminotransferase class I/II-fold pyridoxal phosphate-dependent enzyme [Leptospira kanakyensis]TGK71811.1 aminotransferase class I/II-fold pyridoxal phosphate-dependent enzyme [Leptospira kanakyensis]